jgi:CDP-glycerol glycerophosphotransferase (TagB/SpsB family)
MDIEAYEENWGFMLEPYDAWMPGEIALTYTQLLDAIDNALTGRDAYKKDRERLKRMTHKYTDAYSTQRVLNLARELLCIGEFAEQYDTYE